MYVGSFWDEPLMYDDNAALFDMEERDLMNDLRELPRNSAVRKINELVKRCRLAKVTFGCCLEYMSRNVFFAYLSERQIR